MVKINLRSSLCKVLCISLSLSSILLVGCSNSKTTHRQVQHKRTHLAKHHINLLRPKPNYKMSSERAMYPKLTKQDIVMVNIKQQRVYIKAPIYQNHKFTKRYRTIYTMFASTGVHDKTPRGIFHINNVRTNWFYSPKEHEGAKYAVGWHDGGTYLFHATPANKKGQIYKHVAQQLGKKPSSHGCIHLTLPDAKWFSTHAITGMKVVIK